VTASFNGRTTEPITVTVTKGSVTALVKAGKTTAGRTSLAVSFSGWAALAPRGIVQVYANGSPIVRTTLSGNGTATVRVPAALVKGKKLTVQYFGSDSFEPTISAATTSGR
jgi:hypothetical protein